MLKMKMMTAVSGLVLVACLLQTALCLELDGNDIQNYIKALGDAEKDNSNTQSTPELGIADTTATVGKLFRYTVPKEAFKGDIVSLKVSQWNKLIKV